MQKPTQKKFDPRKNIFDPRNPRINYDPRNPRTRGPTQPTHARNPRYHATHSI